MRMRPRKDFREGAKGPKQMPKIEAKPSRAKNTYAELSWGQQRQKGWGLRPSQPRQRVARHAESLKNCLEVDDLTWVNVKMPGGETTTEGQKYAKHTYINLLSRMKISNRFLYCTTESFEVQRFQLSIIFYSMRKSYLIMALNLLLTMSQLMSPQPCTRNIKEGLFHVVDVRCMNSCLKMFIFLNITFSLCPDAGRNGISVTAFSSRWILVSNFSDLHFPVLYLQLHV